MNIGAEQGAAVIEQTIAKRQTSSGKRQSRQKVLHQEWAEHIPDDEWAIYERAIGAVRKVGHPFLLGGAFGLAAYTGRWRNTKDIDFYVLPEHREPLIEALTNAGFVDYYDKLPYVRHWIYRAWKDDCIVDIIWAMANQRAQVDEEWFERAPQIAVKRETLDVVPAEELLWCKLYVMQKDRCDWPDVLNLIHALGPSLDWGHLVQRLGDDVPLLVGMLNVYCWLCPGGDLKLPHQLGGVLPHCGQKNGTAENQCHINWLDTRPWFVTRKNVS
jgi:hypothetical protein